MKFSPTLVLQKQKEEAIQILESQNLKVRITREDKQYFIGTCEIDADRVNLEIDEGIVVNAALG